MKNRKIYILLIILAVITIPFAKIHYDRYKNEQAKSEQAKTNEQNLAENIAVLTKDTPINIKDITPFEWDEVYFFDPYTFKGHTVEAIGFDWKGFKQQVTEGVMQIIFVKDKSVVCYCCGNGENNGYYFNVNTYDADGMYRKFSKTDKLIFEYDSELSEEYGYNYLTHIE